MNKKIIEDKKFDFGQWKTWVASRLIDLDRAMLAGIKSGHIELIKSVGRRIKTVDEILERTKKQLEQEDSKPGGD